MSTYLTPQRDHGLHGPHPLTKNTINVMFDDDDYGVYMLGQAGINVPQIICYVGRGNLKDRLLAHLSDEHSDNTFFYYGILENEMHGFEWECRLFHLQGKATYLDNINHPPRPTGYKGQKCSEIGCKGEVY